MTVSPPVRHILESVFQPDVAIRLDNVAKAYKLYDRSFSFLKEALTGRPYHRDKRVLSDISLTIERSEIVGIIGRNGAGKSTLLKIIAGTLAPTQGSVSVNGRVSAILELGTGFNPNYSGRDNVILSALMRGMSEEAIRRKFDDIVAFAGLEDVIDQPFHTYSSGMQARLAFAAAVSVEADILIIDEALAAGDIRFAARSLRRIHEICQSSVTALFVSHVTYHVMQLCTRAIWIDEGRVRMDGAPIEVVRAYEYEMLEAIASDQGRGAGPNIPAVLPPVEGPPEIIPNPSADATMDTVILTPKSSGGLTAVSSFEASSGTAVVSEFALVEQAAEQATISLSITPGADSQPPCEVILRPNPRSAPDSAPVTAAESAVAWTSQLPEAAGIAARGKPQRFTSGQYRILDVAFLDRAGNRTNKFRFGDLLRLRVAYECLLPELPEFSCGVAVGFNRIADFEAIMYFNTNYPHSDDELRHYSDVPFRKYIGRKGVIEAVVDPLQLKAGEYYVTVGILPNQPGPHEFYELHYSEYRVVILPNGFDEPPVFYPMVSWKNEPLDQ